MRVLILMIASLVSAMAYGAVAEGPVFLFPQVAKYGGIVAVPDAAETPQRGAKVVFDITADSKPAEVHKGLEGVARYLNLNAQAGWKPTEVKLALVLHGGATKSALNSSAYAKHTGTDTNPNLELIQALRAHGVEVFVCGQSLARNKYSSSEVSSDVTVAVSAMTVNVNKQQAGYAYLSIH